MAKKHKNKKHINRLKQVVNGNKASVDETVSSPSSSIFDNIQIYQQKANTLSEEDQEQLLVELSEMWRGMKTKDDFANVLNKAFHILFEGNAKPKSQKRLSYIALHGRYTSFKIPKKKKGEFRTIDAPCSELRNVQRALNLILQNVYIPNDVAMGFVQGRSVVTGARIHVGQRYVYNIDLKDFFPSITSGRLFKRLTSSPFLMPSDIASLISDLCCYKKEGKKVLPQGAPTSPIITNIICELLDKKLSRLAKAYGLKYTRYADDITFSGMRNVFDSDGKFCSALKRIIEDEEHFCINQDKTRLTHQGERQEVTGLTVNRNVNVSRKYVKQLRVLIHNWEVKGHDTAQDIFAEKYAAEKTEARGCPSHRKYHCGKTFVP